MLMTLRLSWGACLIVLLVHIVVSGETRAECYPPDNQSPLAGNLEPLVPNWKARFYEQIVGANERHKRKLAFLGDPVPCKVEVTPVRGIFSHKKQPAIVTYGYAGFVALRTKGWLFRGTPGYVLYVINSQGDVKVTNTSAWSYVSTEPKLFTLETVRTEIENTTWEYWPGSEEMHPVTTTEVADVEVMTPILSPESRNVLVRMTAAKFEQLPPCQ